MPETLAPKIFNHKLKNIDIRNYNKVLNNIKKIKQQIVFHLAAQTIISKSYELPKYTYEVNSLGTLNLIECLKNLYALQIPKKPIIPLDA